jgi:hypothetical protein
MSGGPRTKFKKRPATDYDDIGSVRTPAFYDLLGCLLIGLSKAKSLDLCEYAYIIGQTVQDRWFISQANERQLVSSRDEFLGKKNQNAIVTEPREEAFVAN